MNMRQLKRSGTRSLWTSQKDGRVTHTGWVMFFNKTRVSSLTKRGVMKRAYRKYGLK